MNYKTLRSFVSTVSLMVLIFLTSCGKSDENKSEQESRGTDVIVGYPTKTKLTEYIDLNANTTYLNQEIVRAAFQGYIEKTFKNVGDKVRLGDVLFLIKTKEADAVGNSNMNGHDEKFSGIIKIIARTDGVVAELNHQSGDYISDGDQLALLVDPQSLRIMMEVPFENTRSVIATNSFVVRLPDGKTYTAHVTKKNPTVDPSNQTQKFILQMNAAPELPANLNVNVRVPVKNFEQAIALPKSSVMSNETQTEFWIMKVLNDSTAVKIDIKKGIEADSLVQIVEPRLNLNDRFIFDGAYGLSDTAKVSINSDKK